MWKNGLKCGGCLEDEKCDFCDNRKTHFVKRDEHDDEWTCDSCYKEQYEEDGWKVVDIMVCEDCGAKENPIAKKCGVRFDWKDNWKIKCPKCWKEEDEDEEYSYYSERYEGCNFDCFRKDYDNVMSDIVYAQQVGLFDQAVWNNLKV